jgi:hypothetical protein
MHALFYTSQGTRMDNTNNLLNKQDKPFSDPYQFQEKPLSTVALSLGLLNLVQILKDNPKV